ncbi:MAG: c-type cytochrome [Alphaproteobacteria bacterium]|nr:c-type cytochrome [Alphaproteobacteria bacterium]
MSGFELNKIMGAILLAALVACLAGFVAHVVVHPHEGGEKAYVVEGVGEETGTAVAAAPAGPEPIAALLASADVAAGQKVSRACAACHDFTKGGPNKVGPNLYGIVMNKHGHMEGFSYSDGMMGMHDKVWTYDELNEFLYNPKAYVPGTKMAFAGIKKTQDRANLIAYLRTLADSPASLP